MGFFQELWKLIAPAFWRRIAEEIRPFIGPRKPLPFHPVVSSSVPVKETIMHLEFLVSLPLNAADIPPAPTVKSRQLVVTTNGVPGTPVSFDPTLNPLPCGQFKVGDSLVFSLKDVDLDDVAGPEQTATLVVVDTIGGPQPGAFSPAVTGVVTVLDPGDPGFVSAADPNTPPTPAPATLLSAPGKPIHPG